MMKTCTNCGKENLDEAVFCSGCGSPLMQAPVPETPAAEAAPETQPAVEAAPVTADEPAAAAVEAQAEPQAAPVQAVDSSAYTAPAAPAVPAESNKATLWLILNIVATVLCCCANLFGILGIIFAAIGMGSYKKGDYEDMGKKSKLAMIMFIIAAVTVVIGWIVAMLSPFLATLPFLGSLNYYN